MEVIIRPDTGSATELVARLISDAIKSKPDLVLGLATGRTMERLYARLTQMHKMEGLDFSSVRTFNLDEYAGLAPDDPNSYRFYMDKHLFNHINIDKRNTFLPDGSAEDLDSECARYERKIEEAGGIDLQLLGIGSDGHIGFNEPLSALRSRTRVKALTPATIAQNSPLFDDPARMPKRAMTMGVGTILDAKRVIMLVTGKSKAEVLAKAVEGPITSMISASALQLHPRCTIITDEDAASCMSEKNYYRWIFGNEPEWKAYHKI